jgi:hypothetical protein
LEAGRGDSSSAATILSQLVEANPPDAELLNDLGVAYSGLGGPSNYLRALKLFERSAQLQPRAAAPRFNLVGTYRKLAMHAEAEVALKEYVRVENDVDWLPELSDGVTANDLLQRLHMHLERKENGLAKSLLRRHPIEYRALALDAALEPPDSETVDSTAEFILEYFAKQDLTLRAILKPLQSPSRSKVLHARRLVREGLQAYYLGESEREFATL